MYDSIVADLKNTYGLTCYQISPVTGGLLNLKWRVSTQKGELLIKQYSNKRFRKEKISLIESRLQRQIALEKGGIPCPLLWQYQGRVIRWLNDETAYMVMGFCSGKTQSSSTIAVSQMRSLGSACAAMHKAFSYLPPPADKSLPASGGYTLELLWENHRSQIAHCPPDAPDEYRKAMLDLELILKSLSVNFFDQFPKGFAHEDFHSGNILFDVDCVSAIVDFDRNCYSYIWHDIGRAILSYALEGATINTEKIQAFLNGYLLHAAVTLQNIVDALRLTWCIETPWWIQPEFFCECDEIPKRFKDEMLWLTDHWFDLDYLLSQ